MTDFNNIVDKVWGSETWIVNNQYCGKLLNLNKGFRCSLHYHKKKNETFYLLDGRILMEVEGNVYIMNPGEKQLVNSSELHRFTGLENSIIIEFSTHHEDSDSYRIKGEESGKVNLTNLLEQLKNSRVNYGS